MRTSPTATTGACGIATALSGIAAGSLCFVSAVDGRSFLSHIREKPDLDNGLGVAVLRTHFAVWWPSGRDYMVPLIAATTIAHTAAYAATGDVAWVVGGTGIAAIAPYTALVLGEDIQALRSADDKEVESNAKRFCHLHHVRTGLAIAAFTSALVAFGRHCKTS